MIKKVYAVFSLEAVVEGFSSEGLIWGTHTFALSERAHGTEAFCLEWIEREMKDFEERHVGAGVRFVVLQLMVFENDKMFL